MLFVVECICNYVLRLMLYGIVCALQEKDQIAETFFEVATNVDPRNVLTWTLLGRY